MGSQNPGAESTSGRILVIDDDAELCKLVARFLSAEGFSVETVRTSTQGVERGRSGEHELIVLDVMLPGMDGFEILRRLRSESRTPVLMLTARGDDLDRILGLEIGADDYLPKPFNPRELAARIRAILRRANTRVSAQSSPPMVREVLGREFSPYDRSIDTHVCNLRKKVGPYSDGSERIKGVRGLGYLFAMPDEVKNR